LPILGYQPAEIGGLLVEHNAACGSVPYFKGRDREENRETLRIIKRTRNAKKKSLVVIP